MPTTGRCGPYFLEVSNYQCKSLSRSESLENKYGCINSEQWGRKESARVRLSSLDIMFGLWIRQMFLRHPHAYKNKKTSCWWFLFQHGSSLSTFLLGDRAWFFQKSLGYPHTFSAAAAPTHKAASLLFTAFLTLNGNYLTCLPPLWGRHPWEEGSCFIHFCILQSQEHLSQRTHPVRTCQIN